ncbi:copper resistance protein NlpE [Echinicola strongylocentroti]|uniref:Copper resistance protein NlpE n=1 Tax=Echinicola strongylocentroti TaxID=1795355 RepID=A0A2Z4IGV0_9BACT|nr:copper resistance protein NlpE [Echinicola strongylocentroti]AWW29937.1 copper resistance protein NlpE [Echinicola strongylocentroti]
MKKLLPYFFLLGTAMSCDEPAQETTNENVVSESAASPADKVLQKGSSTWFTYEGTVPCADCSGIKTTLQLENRPEKEAREYKLTEVYLGTPDGDRSFESAGLYEVTYGTDGNPGAMVITLLDDQGNPTKHFLQERDAKKFTLLDKNKNKIATDLDYSLTIK